MEQFKQLYLLILKNQTSFFREIYRGAKVEDIDLQKHLKENDDNIARCFRLYDVDASGYLDFLELKSMLMDMNLHRQFAVHFNPQYAFDQFCANIWYGFDANMDGKISYEEFIHIHNTVLDR